MFVHRPGCIRLSYVGPLQTLKWRTEADNLGSNQNASSTTLFCRVAPVGPSVTQATAFRNAPGDSNKVTARFGDVGGAWPQSAVERRDMEHFGDVDDSLQKCRGMTEIDSRHIFRLLVTAAVTA